MKIKLFEQFDDKLSSIPESIKIGIGFERINSLKYCDIVYGEDEDDEAVGQHEDENWIEFTDDELNKLNIKFQPPFKRDRNTITNRNINIIKFKDEWYYITATKNNSHIYYECDQWDGLINCLELLIKIEPKEIPKNSKPRIVGRLDENRDSYSKVQYNLEESDEVSDYICNNFLEFERSEIEELNKVSSHFFVNENRYVSTSDGGKVYISNIATYLKKDKPLQICIYKCKDEWFYLFHNKRPEIYTLHFLIYSTSYNNSDFTTTLYKCDQFHGLIECIKMLDDNKLLENRNKYEEVNSIDYNNKLFGKDRETSENLHKHIRSKWIKFTQEEVNLINQLYNSKFEYYESIFGDRAIVHRDDDKRVNIHKLEDEWYYVESNNDYILRKYYKCDQYDGLISCLNFLFNKNINESLEKKYYNICFDSILPEQLLKFSHKFETKINDLLNKYKIVYKIERYDETSNYYRIDLRENKYIVKGYIKVYCLKDEWFYARTYVNDQHYIDYKCDQIEGLLEFLRSRIESTMELNIITENKIDDYYVLTDNTYVASDLKKFDSNDLKKILNFLKEKKIAYHIESFNIGSFIIDVNLSYQQIRIYGTQNYSIYYLGNDYYFMCAAYPNVNKDRWLCDQYEGLIKCITESCINDKIFKFNENIYYNKTEKRMDGQSFFHFEPRYLDSLQKFLTDNKVRFLNKKTNLYDYIKIDITGRSYEVYYIKDEFYYVKDATWVMTMDKANSRDKWICDQYEGLIKWIQVNILGESITKNN